ncbi:MAG: hypothetical protein R2695_04765 [Acidimicrobiales bacterium]
MVAVPILLALGVGVSVGVLFGGRVRALRETRLEHPGFLAVAVGCSAFVELSDAGPSGSILTSASSPLSLLVQVNLPVRGMAIGRASGSTSSRSSPTGPCRCDLTLRRRRDGRPGRARLGVTVRRARGDPATRLGRLGDVYLADPPGPLARDLIMLVGLADVVAHPHLRQGTCRRLPSASALRPLAAGGPRT